MHDAFGATFTVVDDNQPEAALREQLYDVANQDGSIDRDQTSMERSARRGRVSRHTLLRRCAANASAIERTSVNGQAGGTRPADLERYGVLAHVAKDAQSVSMGTIDVDRFGQENRMSPQQACRRFHVHWRCTMRANRHEWRGPNRTFSFL